MAEESVRKRTNLGRGLDALFGDEDDDYGPIDRLRQSRLLPIEQLEPNPYQPRKVFDPAAMESLVESVREQGILQPILVRPVADERDRYQIIAGERRWRAAQQAKLHEVPAVIRDLTDLEALQIAIVENVQRSDLSAIEEAEGYRRLIDEFGYTQADLARVIGKSRSHIANTLRLLDLPVEVMTMLDERKLTAGHARALLTSADPLATAKIVVEQDLSVRQTEAMARKQPPDPEEALGIPPALSAGSATSGPSGPSGRGRPVSGPKDPDTAALEQEMSNLLGLKVTIDSGRGQAGSLTIHYQTLEQLDDVLHRLSHGAR
ncbi:MAG TPA: ParB/RepB/Spo0J family partition protein [Alphaproteobacteria bacterium]|nr:ParB/RepB/Spo0J family partition protein [Alphaproteobacteria bacterium]